MGLYHEELDVRFVEDALGWFHTQQEKNGSYSHEEPILVFLWPHKLEPATLGFQLQKELRVLLESMSKVYNRFKPFDLYGSYGEVTFREERYADYLKLLHTRELTPLRRLLALTSWVAIAPELSLEEVFTFARLRKLDFKHSSQNVSTYLTSWFLPSPVNRIEHRSYGLQDFQAQLMMNSFLAYTEEPDLTLGEYSSRYGNLEELLALPFKTKPLLDRLPEQPARLLQEANVLKLTREELVLFIQRFERNTPPALYAWAAEKVLTKNHMESKAHREGRRTSFSQGGNNRLHSKLVKFLRAEDYDRLMATLHHRPTEDAVTLEESGALSHPLLGIYHFTAFFIYAWETGTPSRFKEFLHFLDSDEMPASRLEYHARDLKLAEQEERFSFTKLKAAYDQQELPFMAAVLLYGVRGS